MFLFRNYIFITVIITSCLSTHGAVAAAVPVVTAPASNKATPKAAPEKGKKTREKEAEGTEAANRFEANTVIKSQYTSDGASIEVDPD